MWGEGLQLEHDLVGLHEQPLHQQQTGLHRSDALVQVRVLRETQAGGGKQVLLVVGDIFAALNTHRRTHNTYILKIIYTE